ncbi:SDA1-domain-containing protein [Venturia nashicola]|uniref:Protein SDA1 n=1 Tax=Venturia nashicola TaxID=86259 RepID=A0A4Z1P791_9PEZI|nr:SDA1-domain-containing protein [Venturia nashicola]TLD27597.1 SDA1-domain-containing protein [Venturia nashicola]
MGKRKIGALEKVEADLPNLQYKIRRDPLSYRGDFVTHYSQYEAAREIFSSDPSTSDSGSIADLREHIDFVAHVASCYPDITKTFPSELASLITAHHNQLEPELREKIVGSLVLLRNKDIIDSITLLNTLFPLLVTTHSKSLRELLFKKIVSDLRSSNAKTTNHKLNKSIQNLLFNLITSDRTSGKGLWAVKITRELWKRQIWTDTKAVEIMKEAALADNEKLVAGGVRFFLGGDKEREDALEDDSSDEDENLDMGKLRHQIGINKKTKKRSKELKRAHDTVKRREKKKSAPHPLNFSALHLLHDPQGFAEELFRKHLQPQKSKLNLEQKLLVLQLVTRLVGLHQLTLVSFYTWILKFLSPKQASVTSYLACLAQASHTQVPPDLLVPCVQRIANEFVSEASASEVCSAGLNAIREICARQPLAMEDTLLQDLVMYRKSKDKGTMMAAKGLLSLYRDKDPEKLKKRDRGKEAALGLRSGEKKELRFGEQQTDGDVVGIELLEAWKEEERQKRRAAKGLATDDEDSEDEEQEEKAEAEGWNNWDVESDSDDSGGWIDVSDDGGEIELSDSEDERPTKKKKLDKVPEAKGEAPKEEEETSEKEEEEKKKSNFATTHILTPADLAKLRELQQQQNILAALPANKKARAAAQKAVTVARHSDDPLTAAQIEGLAKLSYKSTKEEKIALAKADKEEKHQSTTAKRKEKKTSQGKSTTNKEKEREKNFLMTLGKAKRKGKRSLSQARRAIKGDVDRKKRGGKRGNIGC